MQMNVHTGERAHGCFDSRHLFSVKLPKAASCSEKLGGNQKGKLKIADIKNLQSLTVIFQSTVKFMSLQNGNS